MSFVTNILLLFVFTFVSCQKNGIFRKFEYKHCFKEPLIGQKDGSVPFWDHWGHTIASPDRLRITPSLRSQKGQAWNKYQTAFDWWEVEIVFRVTGQKMGADGLAVWFTETVPNKNLDSDEYKVFGSLDKWNGFGLFFDSFDNDNKRNNPYIFGMINDGTKNFDHDNDGFNQKMGGCLRDFRNKQKPIQTKIQYYRNRLTVFYNGGGHETDFDLCFMADNVFLPKAGHFGVSAATGGMADDHDVLQFVVHSLMSQEDVARVQETQEYQKYQKEFEEYQLKTQQAKDEYFEKHPEARKPEDEYLSPEMLSFNQLSDAIARVNTGVRDCVAKVEQVLGKQERTLSLVAGGSHVATGGGQDIGGGVPTNYGSLEGGQRDIANDVRSIKNLALELQKLSLQILNSGKGSVQPAGGSYDMHITLKEMNEGINILKSDLHGMNQRAGGPPPRGGVPTSPCPVCASTWLIVFLMVLQLAILIGYMIYRDSKEAQAKKFY